MCGVAFSTLHGEDDAVAFTRWHVRQVHKDQNPEGLSKEEAREMVVKV